LLVSGDVLAVRTRSGLSMCTPGSPALRSTWGSATRSRPVAPWGRRADLVE